MAKYQYNDPNGIIFSNLNSNPSPKKSVTGKIFYTDNDFEYANEDGISPVVNAVEIDWNGAKPGMGEGENGINTTGELLSILKSYASNNEKINWDEVDLSGSGLNGLDENITYIGSISQLVDLLGAVYEASQSTKAHIEQNGDNQTLVFN